MEETRVASRDNWNVVIAGECMTSRTFSQCDDAASMEVIDLLRNSDVTYAHLEMNFAKFHEMDWCAKQGWGDSSMISDPVIAKEIKWAGVDMMSIAHNHTYDFGARAVISTRDHCEDAGLAVSGIGRDLEEAREPCYFEAKNGRAALVSLASGNPGYQAAGLPKSGWKGRPGVNLLRNEIRYVVDQATADQFKAAAEKLGVWQPNKKDKSQFNFMVPGNLSPQNWAIGDKFEIQSLCHPRDLAANLRTIEEARAMADLVMVAHHFSTSDGPRGDRPPMFVKEFARAAIDAGADIYLGHGWHRTLGIEIYKGKPIFYGLGNFFAQTSFISRVPTESYEGHGHDIDKLPTLHSALHPLHPGDDGNSADTWWSGAILNLEMKEMKVKRIKLTPVELGREPFKNSKNTRITGRGEQEFTEGRPLVAKGKDARAILERYQNLSQEFGTKIRIDGDFGYVEV